MGGKRLEFFVPCPSVTLVGLQGHSGAEVKGGMTACQLSKSHTVASSPSRQSVPGWSVLDRVWLEDGKGDRGWVTMTDWEF